MTVAAKAPVKAKVPQKVANWQNAVDSFPSVKYGVEEWMDFFDRRPDVMHQILGDLYAVVKSDEAKRAGRGRDGPRSMPRNANLAELWDMLTPKYSMETFPAAFKAVQGKRSLRAVSVMSGVPRRTLDRYLDGSKELDLVDLERLAKALHVPPSYFCEWRVQYACKLFAEIMTRKPNLSIGVVKRLADRAGERYER